MSSEVRLALVKQTLLSTVMLAVMLAVFWVAAGRYHIRRLWLFAGVSFIYSWKQRRALSVQPGAAGPEAQD